MAVPVPTSVVAEMRRRIAIQIMAQAQKQALITQQRLAQQRAVQQRLIAQQRLAEAQQQATQQASLPPDQLAMLQQQQQDADDQKANEAFQGVQLQKAVM